MKTLRQSLTSSLSHTQVAYVSFSLGAMTLGAAAVHLNWQQPAATNELLLQELHVPLLLCSASFKVQVRAL